MKQVYVNETYNIEDEANECYLHPDEKFVGVCPLCLNERLISLAYLSKRSLYCLHSRSFNFCSADNSNFSRGDNADKKPVLLRIFSVGSGIFPHLHRKSGGLHVPELDDSLSTSSQEESYISIKIEDNDSASWDKNNTKKSIKSVNGSRRVNEGEGSKNNIQEKKKVPELEHPKPKPAKRRLNWHGRFGCASLRNKKKRTMRGWFCGTRTNKVVEGAEVRKGGCWLRRTLAKRRRAPKKE